MPRGAEPVGDDLRAEAGWHREPRVAGGRGRLRRQHGGDRDGESPDGEAKHGGGEHVRHGVWTGGQKRG